MSFWKRLFGRTDSPIRELKGFLFAVSKQEVESLGTDSTASMVQTVRKLSLDTRTHHVIELSLNGYGDDPRELFEIPEVVRWFQHLLRTMDEVTFWLAPTPLRIALLCVLPNTWQRNSDGKVVVELDPKAVMDRLVLNNVSAAMSLSADGLSLEDGKTFAEQAARNINDAMHGKSFGSGYIVSAGRAT